VKIPLLIFSDTPSAPTGLARICRELATRIATHLPEFEVATIGYGGPTSKHFPFHQYSWTHNDEWIIRDLPEVWKDFAGDRKGILFTIQDPSRMLWLARPQTCEDPRIRQFFQDPPFEKWGYLPLDAVGPNGKYTLLIRECLMGYKRLLCYSQWAENIALATIGISAAGERDLQNLPHGIDRTHFRPRAGRPIRKVFGQIVAGEHVAIADDELLIGIVATNQPRKDYGLMAEVAADLSKRHKVRLWIHTDIMDKTWSIPFLLADFNLTQRQQIVSLKAFPDETMAELYSACDITLAPGLGEGFGYPIFESLACGTPAIHGRYGGAPEYMPESMLVEPCVLRLEGAGNSYRPVFRVQDWVEKIEAVLESTEDIALPPQLDWDCLWARWEKWFRKGLR